MGCTKANTAESSLPAAHVLGICLFLLILTLVDIRQTTNTTLRGFPVAFISVSLSQRQVRTFVITTAWTGKYLSVASGLLIEKRPPKHYGASHRSVGQNILRAQRFWLFGFWNITEVSYSNGLNSGQVADGEIIKVLRQSQPSDLREGRKEKNKGSTAASMDRDNSHRLWACSDLFFWLQQVHMQIPFFVSWTWNAY